MRPATNVHCYWWKVIIWYKIELVGCLLGYEACSILKRGGNYNNDESEECCRCIVNVSCRVILYICVIVMTNYKKCTPYTNFVSETNCLNIDIIEVS